MQKLEGFMALLLLLLGGWHLLTSRSVQRAIYGVCTL